MSNRFWKRSEGLEDRLRAARPQAPERLVRSIADSITPRPLRSRSGRSLGFVAALGVATIALLGASGGFSYAANGVAGAVHATVRLASGPPHPPNTNLPRSTSSGSGSSSTASSADCAQYGHTATITKVSPNAGAAGSKTVITVSGTNLQNATVTAVGDTTTIKSNTDKKILLTLDASTSGGVGAVVASTCVGDASYSPFTLIATPNDIEADTTTLEPGMVIHLTGSGFTGVAAGGVKFDKTPSKDAVVVDDNNITVTVPALKTTSGTITVTNKAGTGTGPTYTYSAIAPAITKTALPKGAKGAVADGSDNDPTTITITGTNFDPSNAITVGGVDATNVNITATSATFTAGPGTPGGKQTVRIEDTLGGTATKAPQTVMVFAEPTLTDGGPALDTTNDGLFGVAAGKGSITLSGSGLTGANLDKTTGVQFTGDTKIYKPSKNTDGSITVAVPKTAQSGTITVINPAGSTTIDGFTLVTAAPAPDAGPFSGHPGGTITITGTGFLGVNSVKVGGKTVNPSTFDISADGTSLSFTIPSNVKTSTKPVKVDIANSFGKTKNFTITVN